MTAIPVGLLNSFNSPTGLMDESLGLLTRRDDAADVDVRALSSELPQRGAMLRRPSHPQRVSLATPLL